MFAIMRKNEICEEKIMKSNDIKKLILAALFLAMALVLPFLTGQIPEIGAMLCPHSG